jgi:hypothetical protein
MGAARKMQNGYTAWSQPSMIKPDRKLQSSGVTRNGAPGGPINSGNTGIKIENPTRSKKMVKNNDPKGLRCLAPLTFVLVVSAVLLSDGIGVAFTWCKERLQAWAVVEAGPNFCAGTAGTL